MDIINEDQLLEHNTPTSSIEKYDETTMNMLYQRRENHRNGTSKSYTVEEFMAMIREFAKQRSK